MQKTLKRYFPIFVLPTLCAFAFAFIIPFVMGVYLSFCKFKTITNAKFIGFDNYIKIFADKDFINAFLFTLKFSAVSIITVNLFAFVLALALTRKIKGTNLFRTVFFIPNLIGGIILGYIWQQMINAVLLKYETTLVANATYGFWGLVILMNWQMIGYMMIIYIAGLQNVPTDLIEAAEIDGATRWHKIKCITLPLLKSTVVTMTLLSIGRIFYSDFGLFYQVTQGVPNSLYNVASTFDTYVYQALQSNVTIGRTAAAGLFQAACCCATVLVANFIVSKIDEESAII